MTGDIPLDWRPAYEFLDGEVSWEFSGAETILSDRQIVLQMCGCRLERPACFWIDPEHVYLRANWREWHQVSSSNPAHIAALIAARYCRILASYEGETQEEIASVHHIDKLPKLFREGIGNSTGIELTPNTVVNKEELAAIEKVAVELGLSFFPHVLLGNALVDASVSNDSIALLLRVIPRTIEHVPLGNIEASIKVLLEAKKTLSELETDSTVLIGLIADSPAVRLEATASKDTIGEGANDLMLLGYDDLHDRLKWLFSPE